MRRFLYIFCTISLFLSNGSNASNVSVTVSASPEIIGITDSLSLRISVQIKGTGQSSSPSFNAPDFKIVGRSNATSIMANFANGKLTPKRTDTYTYTLLPKKIGNLTINAITVKVGGDTYKAEDQKILVQKKPILSPPPPSIQPSDTDPKRKVNPKKKNIFDITLQLSKKKVYLGEAVTANYKILSRTNMKQIHITKWPSFNGFWKEDLSIPSRYNFQRKIINGEIWLESLLASFVIYPLKLGKIEVDSLEAEAAFLTEEIDPFGGNFYSFFNFQGLRKALNRSKKQLIEVLPLPTKGKPDSFSGIVGNLSITLNVAKSKVKRDEAINFEFIVSGIGNFQSIKKPNINFPSSFEIYESSDKTENISSRRTNGLQKRKAFSLIVIPRTEGVYTIDPIHWTYFDVGEEKYKTLSTKPITITVEGGKISSKLTPSSSQKTKGTTELVEVLQTKAQDNIRYLKIKKEILKKSNWNISNIFLKLNKFLVLTICIFLLFILYKVSIAQLRKFRVKEKRENLMIIMKKLKVILDKRKLHYGRLENTLTQLQSSFLEEEIQGITQKEIKLLWEKKKLSQGLLDIILEMKNLCDSKQYSSGATMEEKEKVFRGIEKILELTEKQL